MIFFLIGVFVGCMQTRLRENKIGHKKEFLREIVKEVRINGDKLTLTYKLPITQKTPGSGSEGSGNQEFFTLCHLVEAGGIEPPSENATPARTTCVAAYLILPFGRQTAGFRKTSRFRSRPSPLRHECRPIPLIDALSGPVGEN